MTMLVVDGKAPIHCTMTMLVVDGKAPVGRPRKTWQNNVSAEMRVIGVYPRDFQNHVKWWGVGVCNTVSFKCVSVAIETNRLARQGYAERTAFLQRKNAGMLYFSNMTSVNRSRFVRTFH